jgi:hypothetical protein
MLVRRYRAYFVWAPIGGDQEEPICEEEDTPFVEEGKWLSPSAFSLLNLYHCMLKQLFTILVAMHEIDGQTPFKDLTRSFILIPYSTLFIKRFG